MNEELITPLPGINIITSDENEFPISTFDLVVIVEPDPESYMPLPGDVNKLQSFLEDKFELFDYELDSDNPICLKEPDVVWIRYYPDEVCYFDDFAELSGKRCTFFIYGSEDLDHFGYYLQGFSNKFPDSKVSVIGGMFEDEVICVANFIHQMNLDTSILTRYCISNKSFVNLDNLIDYVLWVRNAERKIGDGAKTLLDEDEDIIGFESDSDDLAD